MNMRRNKFREYGRWALLWMLTASCIVSLTKAVFSFKELKDLNENITYIYKNINKLEFSKDQLEKSEINYEIWLFNMEGKIQSGLGRSVEAYTTYARGNQLLHMYLGLEKEACVLSSELAMNLFGSIDVMGEKITYEEKQYMVKGVIQEEGPVLFLNPLTRNLNPEGEIGVAMTREMGLLQYTDAEHLFQNRDDKIDVDIMKWLVQLLLWMFMVWILLLLLHRVRKQGENNPLYKIVIIVLWIVFMKLFACQTYDFPIRVLPGTWSDFQGWRECTSSVIRQFSNIIRYKDILVIQSYYQGVFGCLYRLIFTGILVNITLYYRGRMKKTIHLS